MYDTCQVIPDFVPFSTIYKLDGFNPLMQELDGEEIVFTSQKHVVESKNIYLFSSYKHSLPYFNYDFDPLSVNFSKNEFDPHIGNSMWTFMYLLNAIVYSWCVLQVFFLMRASYSRAFT